MDTFAGQMHPLFLRLLTISYQASVLALLIIAAQFIFRRHIPPIWRHALWFLLLFRLALPWTPQSDFSIFRLVTPPQAWLSHASQEGRIADSGLQHPVQTAPIAALPEPASKSPAGTSNAIPTPAPAPVLSPPAALLSAKPRQYGWFVIALIWAIGASAMLSFALVHSWKLQSRVIRRRLVTDKAILDLLEDCKEEMRVHVPVALVETPQVRGPALFGFIRPRLLLPMGSLSELNHKDLRWIFLHELAHIRRHDIALNWLIVFAQALHWFNPILWLAFYRMRTDCETASDALVLSRMRPEESRNYGRAIIHLLERFSHPKRMPATAGILEDKSHIKRRLTMIANFKRSSAGAAVASMAVLLFLACAGLTDRPQNPTQSTKGAGSEVDLAIANKDVSIVPYPEGGLYEAHADFKNDTGRTIPAFDLQFFRGDPDKDGKPIREGSIYGVGPIEPGKSWCESSMPFSLAEGENHIYVVVDPNNKIQETNESNNTAYATRINSSSTKNIGGEGQGKYTEEQLKTMPVESLFARIGNPENGYHGFSGLWGLIDKAKASDQPTKDAILKKAEEIIRNPKEDMFRRWQSCYVISGMEDPRGIPTLGRTLQEDPNETVRGVAACALGAFDAPEAKAALQEAAKEEKSEQVRDWIAKAESGQFLKKNAEAQTPSNKTPQDRSGDETSLSKQRDEALTQGNLMFALDREMSRVLLREKNQHAYKDKIDLVGVWEQYRKIHSPAPEAIKETIAQIEPILQRASNDPDASWRLNQLLASMQLDMGNKKAAGERLEEALKSYPMTLYPNPSKYSKYQHIVNQRAELLWDEKGPEAAENFMLTQLKSEPKCEYCFLPWWAEQYKAHSQMDRYPAFLEKVKEAYTERLQKFPERKQLTQAYLKQVQ